MKEQNYFFRLSAYGTASWSTTSGRSRVEPEIRRNEVLSDPGRPPGLLDQPDELRLGDPAAVGPDHVTYVWFDALTNYITAAGYGSTMTGSRAWPANIHMIGKDILRQHAIYWPAMLMAAGIEPPQQVWAHGFLTVGGKKMSKTNATGIHPFELIDRFGVDSYRWYFLREVQFGQDGSFSLESMVDRHNAELANGIGNPRPASSRCSRPTSTARSRSPRSRAPSPTSRRSWPRRPVATTRRCSRSARPRRWPPSTTWWSAPTGTWSSGARGRSPRTRAASRARLDPLRIRGDAPRPRDPALCVMPGPRSACGSSWAPGKPSSPSGSRTPGPGTDRAGTTTKGEALFPRVDADD